MTKIKVREEQRPEDQWNLTSLYKTPFEFEKHLNSFLNRSSEDRWKSLLEYRGKLHTKADYIKDILDLSTDFDQELSRIYTYIFLKHDEDLNCDNWKGFFSKSQPSLSRFFSKHILDRA